MSLRLCGARLAAVPVALRGCAALELLDLSHNRLLVTAAASAEGFLDAFFGEGVAFSTAGSRATPHGEMNLAAATWLAELPQLSTLRLHAAARVVPVDGFADLGVQLVSAPSLEAGLVILDRCWKRLVPFEDVDALDDGELQWLKNWAGALDFDAQLS